MKYDILIKFCCVHEIYTPLLVILGYQDQLHWPGNVIDKLEEIGNFQSFLDCGTQAELINMAKFQGPLTFFVPSDDVFQNLEEDLIESLEVKQLQHLFEGKTI